MVLPSDHVPCAEKIRVSPVRGLIRDTSTRRALGVKRSPTWAKEIATPMAVHNATTGSAAHATVTRPVPSTPTAAAVLGWAMDWTTCWRKLSMRLAAAPPRRGSRVATTKRLAQDPSSDERATLPFSRNSFLCFVVGRSVRWDLSATT